LNNWKNVNTKKYMKRSIFQNKEKIQKIFCPSLNLDGVGKIYPWTEDEESKNDERKNYLI